MTRDGAAFRRDRVNASGSAGPAAGSDGRVRWTRRGLPAGTGCSGWVTARCSPTER